MTFRVMSGTEAAGAGYTGSLVAPAYQAPLNGGSVVGPDTFTWNNAPVVDSADPIKTPGFAPDLITAVAQTEINSGFWHNVYSWSQVGTDQWSGNATFTLTAGNPDPGYVAVQVDANTWQVPIKLFGFLVESTLHNGVPGGFNGPVGAGNNTAWQPTGAVGPILWPTDGDNIGNPVNQPIFIYVRSFVVPSGNVTPDLFAIGLPCRRFHRCYAWEG